MLSLMLESMLLIPDRSGLGMDSKIGRTTFFIVSLKGSMAMVRKRLALSWSG